jgi:hypothetical protein
MLSNNRVKVKKGDEYEIMQLSRLKRINKKVLKKFVFIFFSLKTGAIFLKKFLL